VKKMVEAYPELDLGWEQKTIDLILKLSFDDATAKDGWGTFDPASIEEQHALLDKVGQFPNGRPAAADTYTTKILEASVADRPKFGAPAG
jgi:NitT/TauT family transport system substrate-binding protein